MTYSTQMEAAKAGIVTPEMKTVAHDEGIDVEVLRARVAAGTVAIPANRNHRNLHASGVGEGLRTKINVNLGISGDMRDYDCEMQKVDVALKFGAEAIMDLSNYGKTHDFRRALIEKSPAMIGTVPMYDAVGYLEKTSHTSPPKTSWTWCAPMPKRASISSPSTRASTARPSTASSAAAAR